jgi:hypothetical protein
MSDRPSFVYVIYIASTPEKVFKALTDPKQSAPIPRAGCLTAFIPSMTAWRTKDRRG